MMESKSSLRASPPIATDDAKVLSRRASSGTGAVREAAKTAPEGNALAAENTGEAIPVETDGGDLDQSGPLPNTVPETRVAPEPNKLSHSMEGERQLQRRPPLIRRRRMLWWKHYGVLPSWRSTAP